MDSLWEHYLTSIRRFMEETGVQSREIEKHLNTLTGVRQYLKAVKKLMTGQPAQDCQEIVILQAVCELILFGDYIYVANSAAALSMMIREIEEKESNLPAPMQPKVKEIKDYFTKIKARNEKVENLITKVTKRIDEAEEKDFNISQTEMKRFKMDIMDLEESLKICNNFLTKAETVLGTLASDITSYLIEVGVLGLVGTAVVVLGTAGAGGAAAAAIKGTDAIAKGAAGAGSLAGVSLALYGIYTLYCKYITLKTEKEKLRSELNTLRAEKEERATEVTTVKTKLELLSVE